MRDILKILKDSKKQAKILILKLQSAWNYLILKKMYLQDLLETRQLQIITGGPMVPKKMETDKAILIDLLLEGIEEAIEDGVIEEVMVVTEVVSNHMGILELIISKSGEDIIKREVHGEVEEVIVEDVIGMSEFMKF